LSIRLLVFVDQQIAHIAGDTLGAEVGDDAGQGIGARRVLPGLQVMGMTEEEEAV
jgi:hypothetical protein